VVLAQDPPPPQLVHRPDERVRSELGGLDEQVEAEVAAERGGQAGDLLRRGGRLLEPVGQHVPQVRRVVPLRGGPGGVGPAGQGAGGLDDEQRVAPGRRLQQHLLGRTDRPAQDGRREPAGAGRVEGAQPDVGDPAAGPQRAQGRGDAGVPVELVAPQGGGHEQRGPPGEGQQEREPGHGLLVAPLQVVEHEQDGPVGGEHGTGEPLEESVPLPGVDQRAGAGGPAPAGRGARRPGSGRRFRGTVRDQAGNLRAPGPVEPRHGLPQAVRPQPLRDRGERQPAREAEAVRRRDDRALGARHGRELGDQPRLADPGLPGGDDEPGLAAAGRLPPPEEHPPLGNPPDQAGPACADPRGRGGGRGRPAEQLLHQLRDPGAGSHG
jgi:hypothetical protein